MERGRFVTFEGLDGAGKSTHIGAVVALLESRGYRVVSTREPGGTVLGERLRELLLHQPMHLETEALLMFAARREHLFQVIQPALEDGTWVVCDRFTDASYAYQGGGRGLDSRRIAALEQWTHPDLQPDLTLLFDLPYSVARERLSQARAADRFEREAADFHERVRHAYLARAAVAAGRIRIIAAGRSLPEISKQVEKEILTIC